MKAAGAKTDNIALVHDNTEYGASGRQHASPPPFKEKGLPIAQRCRLHCQRDRRAEPGAAAEGEEARRRDHDHLHVGRDPVLAKTMQALDYKPPMLLADDAGYSDPSFIKAVGKISQGAFNRFVLERRPRRARRTRSSPSSTRKRAATRWTTPPRARCRAFSYCARRSIAPARPIPQRSRRR